MAFSEIELERIEGIVAPLCYRRSPDHPRHQVRTEYRIKGHDVVIVEMRTVWDDATRWMEQPVAKIRFNRSGGSWRLVAALLAKGVAQVGGIRALVGQSGSCDAGRGN